MDVSKIKLGHKGGGLDPTRLVCLKEKRHQGFACRENVMYRHIKTLGKGGLRRK
jgi:hypothetical protein